MLRRPWVSVAVSVFLSPLVSPSAMAQATMEFSCPAPGTKVTLNNGNSTTIRGQEGFYCRVENAKGLGADLYALLYVFTEARKRDPAWTKYIDPIRAERIWPLAVGKKHSGTAYFGSNAFDLHYTVIGQEVLETPMGPQNTFVVELKETGPGFNANVKWWISPKLRYVIKYEYSGTLGVGAYHVTAVALPGDVPNK